MEPEGSSTRLSFLTDPRSPTAESSSLAVIRGDNKPREIDSEFLLRIAAPFAAVEEEDRSDADSTRDDASSAQQQFFDAGSSSFFGNSGPVQEHHGRVIIAGPSSSGKSTLKQMIREERFWMNVTDVQPSVSSSTSHYHFVKAATGNRQTDKLTIDLVDTGPLQRAGLTRFFSPADLIVLTWSLATVKQVKTRTGLLTSTETVVFHPRDIQSLAASIRDLTIAAPGTAIVVMGTHKDVLSEKSIASVEKVVQQLQKHVTESIDAASFGDPAESLHSLTANRSSASTPASSPNKSTEKPKVAAFAPLVLLGCYAVSRVDGKCVSVGGGTQHSITSVWRTLCESVLKGSKASPAIRPAELQRLVFFDTAKQFTDMVGRLAQFINCLRAEHGLCILGLHQLTQSLFAFGAPSKEIAAAALQVLVKRGEVLVLPKTHEYSKQVLLLPHLPSRIVSAVLSVASAMKASIEERVGKSKIVSVDECINADPSRDLSRGVLRMAVVNGLVSCIPSEVAQDKHHIFLRVARQIGLMFKLREVSAASPVRQAAPNVSFSSGSQTNANDKFIVPMLLTTSVAPTTFAALKRECDAGRVHCAARHVYLPGAPSSFIAQLQCQLGAFIKQRTHATRTSAWLTHNCSRALLWVDRDPSALPDVLNIFVWFFSATGDASVRHVALFIAAVMKEVLHSLAQLHLSSAASVTISQPNNATVDGGEALQLGTVPQDDSMAALLRLDLSVAPLAM